MIEKYFPFDMNRFFKDYSQKQSELEEIKQRLQEITEIGAIDYSKVSAHTIPTGLDKMILRKETLELKEQELMLYFNFYDKVMAVLTEREKDLVREKYEQGKDVPDWHLIKYKIKKEAMRNL